MKIVVCTSQKYERYLDLCIAVLEEKWKKHPEIIVFSNRGGFDYKNRIIHATGGWVPMMKGCLEQLFSSGRVAADEPIILILEDHVPFARIDGALMFRLAEFLKDVSGCYLNLGAYGRGPKLADLQCCSIHLMELHAYSSLHPAIWTASHLLRSLIYASEHGIDDPWRFEKGRFPDAKHFTSGVMTWPSVHGGFLWQGKVNVPALAHMNHGTLLPLRTVLLKKLILEAPGRWLIRRKVVPGSAG
jgi:hypothetical protein